jgi:N-acetylmuramoyl-L-alanine amidase
MAKKILLDAGHYAKYNQSPHVKGYWESQRMWVLMRLLQMKLEKIGYIVHSTRDEQAKDLAVVERGKKAKGYDMFISLHSNDFDGSENIETAKGVDYVVAYVPSYANNSRCKNSKKLGLQFAEYIAGVIGSKQKARASTRLKSNGDEYYGVLRGWQNTNCPVGFIIEHGFHSNPKTAQWLLDDENLMNLAAAEANMIDAYFKGVNSTTTTTPTESKGTIKVGSIVKIKDGAKLYNSDRKLSSWVYPLEWVVLQIKGDRVVIDKSADGKHSIETPIDIDDLTLVR